MAEKYLNLDDDEEDVLAPKEPQVSSSDPAERKAARALRIKKRQDALKRAEQPLEEIATEEEPGLIEQASAAAAFELQRLALDGAAKVTNVKVTTDEREVHRRQIFTDKMKDSLERIETEALEAQLQYEAITLNWDQMLKVKDPLDINDAMEQQRKTCDQLLSQKNKLIDELKHDLKKMDEGYNDDLEKQDRDIKELSDRIEKQITIMQKAYEKQLSLIEQAINIERHAMVEHNNKRWEALYKQRDKEEVAHMEYKFQQLEEHKQAVEEIMWDHQEKYRAAKIELETLLQELQKELEKLKATCIINAEKIGYNYQVLKKREEENVFVRSQQKRKLNKMADVANDLRARIKRAVEDGAAEELKADAEIEKLMQSMQDLEKKSNHFAQVNDYKFNQVWRMSASRCSELVQELRQAEVSLHAHVLSEPPPPPPPPPPTSPLKRNAEGEDSNKAVATGNEEDINEENLQEDEKKAKDRLVRHILRLVADNTGFLIEDRLFTLIEKYQEDSRNLCTLDAIFMALEIQSEEDIELLCRTFMKYAFCPVCTEDYDQLSDTTSARVSRAYSQDETPRLSMSSKIMRDDRLSLRGRASISITISTSRSIHFSKNPQELSPSDQQLVNEADQIIQKVGDIRVDKSTSGSSEMAVSSKRGHSRAVTVNNQVSMVQPDKKGTPYLCPIGHPLEIETMQVLTALSEFVSVFVSPEKMKLHEILDSLKPPDFNSPSRMLKREDIEKYWAQWRAAFPPEKDRFWDGMLSGLTNYLSILQERARLHEQVQVLRQRNAALRKLVRGTLPEMPTARCTTYRGPKPFTSTGHEKERLPPI